MQLIPLKLILHLLNLLWLCYATNLQICNKLKAVQNPQQVDSFMQ